MDATSSNVRVADDDDDGANAIFDSSQYQSLGIATCKCLINDTTPVRFNPFANLYKIAFAKKPSNSRLPSLQEVASLSPRPVPMYTGCHLICGRGSVAAWCFAALCRRQIGRPCLIKKASVHFTGWPSPVHPPLASTPSCFGFVCVRVADWGWMCWKVLRKYSF